MATWSPFPHPGLFSFTTDSVKKSWAVLHAGDAEPLPRSPQLLQAWAHFHNGEFSAARTLGLEAAATGDTGGMTVANKATCIYACYLEKSETARLDLFMDVAQRAAAQTVHTPQDQNAWFLQAYALGRYSQAISVAKALAQGLGSKVKDSLEKTLEMCPKHVEARIALGSFHAEVIDKVGALIGGMTYGARKDIGLQLLADALQQNSESAAGLVEYADALVMLNGEACHEQANQLYERAASCVPVDAMEALYCDLAKTELATH